MRLVTCDKIFMAIKILSWNINGCRAIFKKSIDLARPKENEKNSGFMPIERAWLDKITAMGWMDTFRSFHPEPGNYTWWDYKTCARERNVGWRLDYFFINEEKKASLRRPSYCRRYRVPTTAP